MQFCTRANTCSIDQLHEQDIIAYFLNLSNFWVAKINGIITHHPVLYGVAVRDVRQAYF